MSKIYCICHIFRFKFNLSKKKKLNYTKSNYISKIKCYKTKHKTISLGKQVTFDSTAIKKDPIL